MYGRIYDSEYFRFNVQILHALRHILADWHKNLLIFISGYMENGATVFKVM